MVITWTSSVVTWGTAIIPAVTSAVIAWTSSVITAITSATVISMVVTWTSRSTLRLYITFRFLCESTHRKSHLAGLLVDFKKFDIHFVTYIEDISHILSLVPSDLRHVEQTFLSREDLYECTEIKDRNNFSMICCTYLRNCADTLNPRKSLVERILICREDIYDTLASLRILSDGDGSTGLFLNLLDSLTTFTDNGTNEI